MSGQLFGLTREGRLVPLTGTIAPKTYAEIRDQLKEFGTILEAIEANVPFDLGPAPSAGAGDTSALDSAGGSTPAKADPAKQLYFSIRFNRKV